MINNIYFDNNSNPTISLDLPAMANIIENKSETIDVELMTEDRERKILQEARENLKIAMEYDAENKKDALDDLQFAFVEGAQWPTDIKTERISEGRPCISINKMPTYIDQVVGDQRQNRPSIKVLGVDSSSDPYIATIITGWIRHILQTSQADIAIDHAFEHTVSCGYGAFRVVTKYSNDSSFEQDVFVEKIDNALAVYWGKHSKYDCSDANYCFVITDMDRKEFEKQFGINAMSFNQADPQFIEGWATESTVRVAEYFVKEPIIKILYQLNDGRTVDKLNEGDIPVKNRKVKSYKIKWYLLSGNKILEERDWVGKKYIPIIPVWGKEINVGGKRFVRSLIRFAKDAQRMYNYWNSVDTESVALSPKVPYLATPTQIGPHKTQWDSAHKKSYPYLLVEPDSRAPGWPKREPPPQVSTAMVEKLRTADQEIRDTIGLQKASMGIPSNERSGIAIRERKQEGDVGTFAFIDNLARSFEYLGRVLVDIAPGVLDTERIIRLGFEDELSKFEQINVQTPDGIFNDISIGQYDVVVTTGPSFTTQRTEARQSMAEFIQYYPQAATLIGDLYAKLMDWPGASEVAERLENLLPPEIKEKKMLERAKKEGISPPAAVQPQQPLPDPLTEAKIQESNLKLQELLIQIEQEKVRLEGMRIENEMKISNSKENIKQKMKEIMQESI